MLAALRKTCAAGLGPATKTVHDYPTLHQSVRAANPSATTAHGLCIPAGQERQSCCAGRAWVSECPVRAQQRLSTLLMGPPSPGCTGCAASALHRNSVKAPACWAVTL